MPDTPTNITAQPSFSDVAKEVIRNSIRSAICIDDRYAAAYEEDTSRLNVDEPRKLHRSFREDGLCDLDIYRFTTFEETWNSDVMLSNKDLLILDWELDADGNYDNAVKILNEVVQSKKIPFVVVYTSTADLHSVSKALVREFSPYNTEAFQEVSSALKANYSAISDDPDSIEADIFLEENTETFYEYLFNWNNREETESKLLTIFRQSFAVKAQIGEAAIKAKVSAAVRTIADQHDDGLLELSMMAMCQESVTKSPFRIERISTAQHAFYLNGTIVLAYHKQDKEDGIKPENLFAVFAEAIVSNPHNYLNILSLELKDRLRESFSRIGTQFSKTDEQAFFYHLENYRTLNNGSDYDLRSVYDFILKSWIGELYQQRLNEQPRILKFANHRFESLEFPPPKQLAETHKDLISELIKYCAYVSTSKVTERNDMTLRFGDLFVNSDKPNEFFLCITPSCDCLHPKDNINDNFYFVKGANFNGFQAIREAETGFHSFVLRENEPKCIKWQCKPFTSYISTNDVSQLKINYCGVEIQLRHLIVLKENYAQRIANESFGYGHRVGIDLPH
ncbi:response regulator receiver domain [Flagellimonas okinawensis]|uniref:Response regulator receiver domain n=1 Tax=Flagellimonas okinawensis TaxID=3031324 RepID=A0ABT5XM55_9FLAO|nr:response regulator receiver domain [[Muricauda] okinawensis]MDF0706966.1 response regulator receiver domain [[Muricauda] okinawensis]